MISVGARLEELAWSPSPIGPVSLRRRRDLVSGEDVFEVKLGDEFLMSSLFTVAEVALSRLALARVDGAALDVVVGGLGLGYTAQAALDDSRVRELVVIDALAPVIDWHQRGLVPVGPGLTADARCRLVHADFFAMANGAGFDPDEDDRRFDAVVVDIDHSPRHLLAGVSAPFYQRSGTEGLARHLRPGGVYALWSNDPPDGDYLRILEGVFDDVAAEVISFPNPLQDRMAANTIYLASKRTDR